MLKFHDLRPCPFCGSKGVKYMDGWEFSEKGWFSPQVICCLCGVGVCSGTFAGGMPKKDVFKKTAQMWNRRQL